MPRFRPSLLVILKAQCQSPLHLQAMDASMSLDCLMGICKQSLQFVRKILTKFSMKMKTSNGDIVSEYQCDLVMYVLWLFDCICPLNWWTLTVVVWQSVCARALQLLTTHRMDLVCISLPSHCKVQSKHFWLAHWKFEFQNKWCLARGPELLWGAVIMGLSTSSNARQVNCLRRFDMHPVNWCRQSVYVQQWSTMKILTLKLGYQVQDQDMQCVIVSALSARKKASIKIWIHKFDTDQKCVSNKGSISAVEVWMAAGLLALVLVVFTCYVNSHAMKMVSKKLRMSKWYW